MLAQANNLARFLYHQRIRGFDPPSDEPFMDPEGSARFKSELAKATRYLEFGSGGTTVLADRAGIDTISVENDRFYARAVASQLSGDTVTQIVVNTGATREWGFPLRADQQRAWDYISAASKAFPLPDFILIDGRWRVACALERARLSHVCRHPATLMFDDYAGRPHYHSVEAHLGKPEMAGRAAIFLIGEQAIDETAAWNATDDPR